MQSKLILMSVSVPKAMLISMISFPKARDVVIVDINLTSPMSGMYS